MCPADCRAEAVAGLLQATTKSSPQPPQISIDYTHTSQPCNPESHCNKSDEKKLSWFRLRTPGLHVLVASYHGGLKCLQRSTGVSGLGFGPLRVFIRFNGRHPRFRAGDSRAESAADKSCRRCKSIPSLSLSLFYLSIYASIYRPVIDVSRSCYSLVKL